VCSGTRGEVAARKDWRKEYSEELHGVCSSPDTISMVQSVGGDVSWAFKHTKKRKEFRTKMLNWTLKVAIQL